MADHIDMAALDEDVQQILRTIAEDVRQKQESSGCDGKFLPDFGDLEQAWAEAKTSSVTGDWSPVKRLYDCIEFEICGTEVENFEIYEICFEALIKIGIYLGFTDTLTEMLVMLLMNINEIYDALLNCVETYEWVQPGVTGLLRM